METAFEQFVGAGCLSDVCAALHKVVPAMTDHVEDQIASSVRRLRGLDAGAAVTEVNVFAKYDGVAALLGRREDPALRKLLCSLAERMRDAMAETRFEMDMQVALIGGTRLRCFGSLGRQGCSLPQTRSKVFFVVDRRDPIPGNCTHAELRAGLPG